MLFWLNLLNFIIPIFITIALYFLYYYLFIILYVKRIKKAIDAGDVEEAERMKKIAMKRQPKKIAKLFRKYDIIKEEDEFCQYQIEDFDKTDDDHLFSIQFALSKKDVIHYINWINFNKIPFGIKITILACYVVLILLLSIDSYISLIVMIAAIFALIAINWVLLNIRYRNYLSNTVKLVLYNDRILLYKKEKAYRIKGDLIKQIQITKKYIYVFLLINKVFIIPKRFINEDDYSKVIEYLQNLESMVR